MGKTAVFVISTLQQLDANPLPGSVLVLCPMRELAYQIARDGYERLTKHLPSIKTAMFYGGVPIGPQKDLLRDEKPHIIVGTPGRILQLAEEKSLSLKNVKHFILDECDKMLDSIAKDMRKDVQSILKLTPREKQVMMFSATLSDSSRSLCKRFMNHPLEIYINEEEKKLVLHGLQQYYVSLAENEKNRNLIDLLDALDFNQLIVFVSSVSRAAELNKLLIECNFPSVCTHSGLGQEERIEQYKNFKEFKTRILVSTNLFGRGIDVDCVNVVINYDMAENADTYLHRVARAGRFGAKGLAISFVSTSNTRDSEVLNEVKTRAFNVDPLPATIDTSTYMGS